MPLTPLKCSDCGATLQVTDNQNIVTCPYCGATFTAISDVNNYNITNITNNINVNINNTYNYTPIYNEQKPIKINKTSISRGLDFEINPTLEKILIGIAVFLALCPVVTVITLIQGKSFKGMGIAPIVTVIEIILIIIALIIKRRNNNQFNQRNNIPQNVNVDSNSWKCSKCGRINPKTIVFCRDCGESK